MNELTGIALLTCLATPLACALALALFRNADEPLLARMAKFASLVTSAASCFALITWISRGRGAQEAYLGNLFESQDYAFPFVLFLDAAGAVFLIVATFLQSLIVRYCRYYLHREEGYGRFFATLFLFWFGINLLFVSGSLDLLFAGWEVVGIASFLLIGFYRTRTSPQRNALRAYSVYRLCDIGVLLSAWLGHLIWHHSQQFSELAALDTNTLLSLHPLALAGLSVLVLIAACGKSAQFPFCFWLPRAMEGPTPSSAIFYGALSVHAGVFLLIRTGPIWETMVATRVMVGSVGFLTAVLATLSGRVQSNIKGQLGYASVAQVGLMLVELACGLHALVLVHFVGNACLRCYQLLVSPSVVAHLLRIQSTSTRLRVSDWSVERYLPARLRISLFALALNEGYLELLIRSFLWTPIRWLGSHARQLHGRGTCIALLITVVAFMGLSRSGSPLPPLGMIVAAIMILFSFSAFAERDSALTSWVSLGMSTALAPVAVLLVSPDSAKDLLVYLSGVVPAWMIGAIALRALDITKSSGALSFFHGMAKQRPFLATLFFLCGLGITGFPITPAFVGEDLLLHYSAGDAIWLAGALMMSFVTNGITTFRLYSRLFLGPQEILKPQEPVAARG